jgi:hypothetical protein
MSVPLPTHQKPKDHNAHLDPILPLPAGSSRTRCKSCLSHESIYSSPKVTRLEDHYGNLLVHYGRATVLHVTSAKRALDKAIDCLQVLKQIVQLIEEYDGDNSVVLTYRQ